MSSKDHWEHTFALYSLADLGDVPGSHPLRVQILTFQHTKFSKCDRLGSLRPPNEVEAPLQEILDPPLVFSDKNFSSSLNQSIKKKMKIQTTEIHCFLSLIQVLENWFVNYRYFVKTWLAPAKVNNTFIRSAAMFLLCTCRIWEPVMNLWRKCRISFLTRAGNPDQNGLICRKPRVKEWPGKEVPHTWGHHIVNVIILNRTEVTIFVPTKFLFKTCILDWFLRFYLLDLATCTRITFLSMWTQVWPILAGSCANMSHEASLLVIQASIVLETMIRSAGGAGGRFHFTVIVITWWYFILPRSQPN